ncbi:Thiamine-monophosphate kinase [hydrothermal vent metagenome]|uniref:Thiamine-monophosphate kinase n=1 Tax=hydrothermal vent metagenome TaxID=652676 RepID=A0A3B0QWT9_9ZZZZ
MQLKELGEKALIDILGKRFSETGPRVLKGIGDDCAATLQAGGKVLLSSTDTLTEEVHFSLTYSPPKLLGRKLVNISVSDIAAMGGTPLFILLALTMPATIDEGFVTELYRGVEEACGESAMVLIGGNISSTAGENPIVLTSMILGEVPESEMICRTGAAPGETIYITGSPGAATLGLIGLQNDGPSAITRSPYRNSVARHLDPKPRTKIARTIARKGLATSMMDTSDGLASDLTALAKASNIGALVKTTLIPISPEMKTYLKNDALGLEIALSGGEDYELLFTAKKENKEAIERLAEQSGIPITEIGVTEERDESSKSGSVRFIQNDGTEFELKNKGFDHYK